MASKRKSTVGKPATKRSRTDNKIPTVVEAFAHSDAVPAGLRALLKISLPVAFNTDKADRHAYEAEVVDQAQQVLAVVEAALKQEHSGAVAKQSQVIAPEEIARRSATKGAAEAHLEAEKVTLEGRKAAKKAAEQGVHEAEHGVKAAQADAKVADKALQRSVDRKATLSDALSTEFVLLKDGSSAAAAGKKALQKVLGLAKAFVSTTMSQTFPLACKKPATSRTEFEASVFNSMQGLFEREIAKVAAEVGELEPPKAAADSALSEAKGTLERAEATLKSRCEDLDATHTSQKEAVKDLAKADAARRAIWKDMQQACDAQDDVAGALKNFTENIWVAFNALKEKEPEPEPVEPEPVVEEVAVAEEVPAAETAPAPVVETPMEA